MTVRTCPALLSPPRLSSFSGSRRGSRSSHRTPSYRRRPPRNAVDSGHLGASRRHHQLRLLPVYLHHRRALAGRPRVELIELTSPRSVRRSPCPSSTKSGHRGRPRPLRPHGSAPGEHTRLLGLLPFPLSLSFVLVNARPPPSSFFCPGSSRPESPGLFRFDSG